MSHHRFTFYVIHASQTVIHNQSSLGEDGGKKVEQAGSYH